MIVVYMRVSDDDQREKCSIQLQQIELKEFCERNHYRNPVIIADDGVKGELPLEHRPGGRKLLALLATGKVERVVVWKVDRLSRGVEAIPEIAKIESAGAVLESKLEGIQSLKDATKIMMTLMSVGVGMVEVTTLRSRVKTRYFQLANDGVFCGGRLKYGFTLTEAHIQDRKRKVAVVNPEEAAVCVRAYRMVAKGLSSPKVADELNRLGLLWRGTPWTGKRVQSLIKSSAYRGEYTYGKLAPSATDPRRRKRTTPRDQWKTRSCPAIVTEELWHKANAELHRNQIVAMSHPINNYLLRGLIVCGACGLKYVSTAVGTHTKRYYYRCHGARAAAGPYGKAGKRCPSPSQRGKELEAAIWTDVLRYINQPGSAMRDLQKVLAQRDQEQPIGEEINGIEKRLASRSAARERVLELFQDGLITKEDLKTRLMKVNTEAIGLEKDLAALRKRAQDNKADVRELRSIGSVLQSLQKVVNNNPPFEVKRRVVETLIKEIRLVVEDGRSGLVVSYVFPTLSQRHQNNVLLPNQPVRRSGPPRMTYLRSNRPRFLA